MTILHAVVLGVVQGLTEFFPVSSSGHLVLLQGLFGLESEQLTFDVFLHLGTLVSIVVFFRKDIISLFKNKKLLGALIIASIPTFAMGFLFKDVIESFFGMPNIVAIMLIVTGAVLIAAQIRSRTGGSNKEIGVLRSLIIGAAQGAAIIPGISRSGSTIAAGLFCGLEKEFAVKFSFLLAIPAILGASLLKITKIGGALTGGESFAFLLGGFTACITGIFAIKILLKLVKSNRLYLFGIYCILLGALIFILV